MSAVTLTQWGNSWGIRIPAPFLKKIKARLGERFELSVNKKGGLTLTPLNHPQEGWLEAFNATANADDEKLLPDDLQNDFDRNEWKW